MSSFGSLETSLLIFLPGEGSTIRISLSFSELYTFKWTTLLIPLTTKLLVNIVGVGAGISNAINNSYESWGPGRLFFAFWVIVHLYPFLKGLVGRHNKQDSNLSLNALFLLFEITSYLYNILGARRCKPLATQPLGEAFFPRAKHIFRERVLLFLVPSTRNRFGP